MKTTSKLMIAAGVLVGGVANAAISPYPATGSDLVLFVTDLTNGTSMFQDLGVTLNSLGVTTASVQADATAGNAYSIFGTGTTGPLGSGSSPIQVGAGLITGGVDTAVAAFTSGHTGDNIVYGILAAASGDGSVNAGQSRLLVNMTSAQAAQEFQDEPNTANVNGAVSSNAAFFAQVVAGTTTAFGSSTGGGFQASSAYSIGTQRNSNTTGTTTFLVEFAGFGVGTDANVYQSLTPITLSSNGAVTGLVSGTSAVPLPAAVWLLGSGVVGLLGIGRRRAIAKA
jgi:hypothetical protein